MNGENVVRMNRRPRNDSRGPSAVGHEKLLATMISNRHLVVFGTIHSGHLTGLITHFDKWSVTIRVPETDSPIVMFKHSIAFFRKMTPEELWAVKEHKPAEHQALIDLQNSDW